MYNKEIKSYPIFRCSCFIWISFEDMALRAGIRQSRGISSLTSALKSTSTQCSQKQVISSYRFKYSYNNGNSHENSSQQVNWPLILKYGAAAGLTALALDTFVPRKDLLAEDDIDITDEIIDKENR